MARPSVGVIYLCRAASYTFSVTFQHSLLALLDFERYFTGTEGHEECLKAHSPIQNDFALIRVARARLHLNRPGRRCPVFG